MKHPHWPTTWMAAALLAALSSPAHAVIGVYNQYFVTAEATDGAGFPTGYVYYNQRASAINALPGMASDGRGNFSSAGSSTDTTGRLTAATAAAAATTDGTAFSRTVASADIANASLHLTVLNNPGVEGEYVGGYGFAQWHDIVTFTVAGAGASTRTRVDLEFSVDGRWQDSGLTDRYGNQGTGFLETSICLGNPSSFGCVGTDYSLYASAVVQFNRKDPNTPVPTIIGLQNGFDAAYFPGATGSWEGSTPELLRFRGSFELVGATATLNPTMSLGLNCDIGVSCDFGHTATLRFLNLPAGVSFSSDSGVFMSAVPEPASWALLAGGLALLGARARRRSAA